MAEIKYGKDYYGSSDPNVGLDKQGAAGLRHMTGSTWFRGLFDPLGVADAALSKFAPDEVVGNDINYGDYEDKQMTETLNKLREFYARLGQPLDMNDPDVQRIVGMASNKAMQQSSNQGIRGGLSVSNTEANVGGALGQYSMDRQKMYMDGMSRLAHLQGMSNDAQYGRYMDNLKLEQGRMDQLRSDLQQKNAGVLGLAGTVIGGMFGKPEVGQAFGNASGGQSVGTRGYAGGGYGGYGGGGLGGT
jgi:hypothetical protein